MRDKVLSIRLSGKEQKQIVQQAARAGIKPSAFAREAALGHVLREGVPALNREAWSKLSSAAATLNQIAHRLNSLQLMRADAGLAEIAADAENIRHQLQQFRRALLVAKT